MGMMEYNNQQFDVITSEIITQGINFCQDITTTVDRSFMSRFSTNFKYQVWVGHLPIFIRAAIKINPCLIWGFFVVSKFDAIINNIEAKAWIRK